MKDKLLTPFPLALLACIFGIIAIVFCFSHNLILSYGDAESHLNIAKRIVDSLTPGFSQLGGVWLPLPHILMIPFVAFDPLWRTGLAGSIIGIVAYIVSCLTLFALLRRITHDTIASFLGFLVFALNPNILFVQSTPLTEMPLMCFFLLSTYFFVRFFENTDQFMYLVFSAFFGFCASLSRYDGWFLVVMEFGILCIYFLVSKQWRKWFGMSILFGTLAFFGILMWFIWDWLILGDPLYFSTSQFSAASQQMAWLARGQLPARHNIVLSFLYYLVASVDNIGLYIAVAAFVGILFYLLRIRRMSHFLALLLLMCPFIFYVVTLFTGQSVIFTPELTPASYQWHLFNIRYGLSMVPAAAFFLGFIATAKIGRGVAKVLVIGVLVFQTFLFATGSTKAVTVLDGTQGLSRATGSNAQIWLDRHYDNGLILFDDYSRTISIVKSPIPMKSVIYIGNKPYWQDSLVTPEKYATWIVMQKDDSVWTSLWSNPVEQKRLFKYFQKVYTSPTIIIFRKPKQTTG